ncbi:unnamed protein product [Nyctereutes procyonoides]|uniref:(raccoon dog) hypothetical protein n=1 Tax=Nyctereutes procyonoides TaxID=34880 RepID=A0A811Z4E9_NYCPR|nr:unnamed protein product [Nyctereutes procyonoides]
MGFFLSVASVGSKPHAALAVGVAERAHSGRGRGRGNERESKRESGSERGNERESESGSERGNERESGNESERGNERESGARGNERESGSERGNENESGRERGNERGSELAAGPPAEGRCFAAAQLEFKETDARRGRGPGTSQGAHQPRRTPQARASLRRAQAAGTPAQPHSETEGT